MVNRKKKWGTNKPEEQNLANQYKGGIEVRDAISGSKGEKRIKGDRRRYKCDRTTGR
jgi:hypothetical protein